MITTLWNSKFESTNQQGKLNGCISAKLVYLSRGKILQIILCHFHNLFGRILWNILENSDKNVFMSKIQISNNDTIHVTCVMWLTHVQERIVHQQWVYLIFKTVLSKSLSTDNIPEFEGNIFSILLPCRLNVHWYYSI